MAVTFFRVGADQSALDRAFPDQSPVKQATAQAHDKLTQNQTLVDERGQVMDRTVVVAGQMDDEADQFAAMSKKLAAAGKRKPGCCAGACVVQ